MADTREPATYRVAADPRLRIAVLELGLACCAMEVNAAISQGLLVPEASGPDPSDAVQVLVIAGTVTTALVPAVEQAWQQLPEPRAALSFGSCANTGGPYWDAPTVVNGVDSVIPVAGYVPGCPPRPEGLIAGLQELAARVAP